MDIQNLVRERVIGNIKTGMKGPNGIPKKLPYFHVEEDKATSSEMVEIFKELYPNKPTNLKIRFTSENPFNFKFKRYVNNKVACIGNGNKAITVGKDSKGNNTQIEVECSEECEHLKNGKCKLIGSLKFVLDGIEAGGVWKLNTGGGISLSNIASEIVKYKKAKMSIVDVPFELTLTEQESLAYGKYYSIDLHRMDIKPQLVNGDTSILLENKNSQEVKQLSEGTKKKVKKDKTENKNEQNIVKEQEEKKNEEKTIEEDHSKEFYIKAFMPALIKGTKFDKIIFQDINEQDVEYVLHPNADQSILKYGIGSLIEIKQSKMELDRNILCKYEAKQIISPDGTLEENSIKKLKEAV